MGKASDMGIKTPDELYRAIKAGKLSYDDLSATGKSIFDAMDKSANGTLPEVTQNQPERSFGERVHRGFDIATDAAQSGMTFGVTKLLDRVLEDKFGWQDPTKVTPETKFESNLAKGIEMGTGSLAGGAALKAGGSLAKNTIGRLADTVISAWKGSPKAVKAASTIAAGATGIETARGALDPDYAQESGSLPAEMGASLRAGTGDVLNSAGQLANWKGYSKLGDTLEGAAKNLQTGYELQPEEFSWKSFFNPHFYSKNVARSVPFTASLIPAMYAGYKLGGAAGGKFGLGSFGKTVMASVGGTTLSRPIESAMEAGNTYEEALTKGLTHEQADKVAQQVFLKNLAMAGADVAQLALAFGPASSMGKNLATKAATNSKIGQAFTKLAKNDPLKWGFEIASEAGEEGYQQAVQQQALGNDERSIVQQIFNPDKAMQESMAIGGLFGGVMGGAGEIHSYIKNRVADKIPEELKTQVAQDIENYMDQGDDEATATDKALDNFSETPEGKEIVSQATQEVVTEIEQEVQNKQGGKKQPEVKTPAKAPEGNANTVYHVKTGEPLQVIQSTPEFVVVQKQDGSKDTLPVTEITTEAPIKNMPENVPGKAGVIQTPTPEIKPSQADVQQAQVAKNIPTQPEMDKQKFIQALQDSGTDPASEQGQQLIIAAGLDTRGMARQNDAVTGFLDGKHHDSTLDRVWNEAQQQGDQSFSYGYLDVHNLGGLNAHRGNHEDANADLGNMAEIIRTSLQKQGIEGAQIFRKGGDEYQVIAPYTPKETLDKALGNAKAELDTYSAANGLKDIPHLKKGRSPGFGIDYAVSDFKEYKSAKEMVKGTDAAVSKQKETDRKAPEPAPEQKEPKKEEKPPATENKPEAPAEETTSTAEVKPETKPEPVKETNKGAELYAEWRSHIIGDDEDPAVYEHLKVDKSFPSPEGTIYIVKNTDSNNRPEEDDYSAFLEKEDGTVDLLFTQSSRTRDNTDRQIYFPDYGESYAISTLDVPEDNPPAVNERLDYIRKVIPGIKLFADKEAKGEIAAGPTNGVWEGYELTVTKKQHTQTGEDLWVVSPVKVLGKDKFQDLKGKMKKLGVGYSRFTRGFNFKSDPTEQLFGKQEVKEEKPAEAKTDVPDTNVGSKTEKATDKSDYTLPSEIFPPKTAPSNEYAYKAVNSTVKTELNNFSKKLAERLGYEHDTDKKGKTEYSNVEFMDAITIILWKPNTEYGIYIKFSYEEIRQGKEYNYNSSLKMETPILYRVTTKDKKYTGLGNNFMTPASYDLTVSEMALLVEPLVNRQIAFDERKKAAEAKPEAKPEDKTKPEKEPDTSKNETSTVELTQEEKKSPSLQIAEWVTGKLDAGEKITNKELFAEATKAFKGKQTDNAFTPKDSYDAMELGVNKWLLGRGMFYGAPNKIGRVDYARKVIEKLQEVLSLLPTQANRTTEQQEFQQFSTPPSIAYVASWVANMNSDDTVLEPSAGIGGLAVFGKIAGAKVVVNELSKRRAEVLKEMGFDRLFTENAEQLNNILPKDVKPTTVIMNPPFSSTAGRMGDQNKTKYAKAHIEQALKRLQPGGRLVAILGRGMANDTATFKEWWNKLRQEYTIQANIGINGDNYKKYGTSFDVQIVVIDKIGPNQKDTIVGKVDNLEDILPLLEGVRNDRTEQRVAGSNEEVKSPAGEPAGGKTPANGQGGTRPEPSSSVSSDGVGTEQRPSGNSGRKPQKSGEPTAASNRPDKNEANTAAGDESTPGGRTGTGSELAGPEGTSNNENPVGSSAVPSGNTTKRPAGQSASGRGNKAGLKVETKGADEAKAETELSNEVYSDYVPQKLKVPGAKPHPADLVQSTAMASVIPPDPTYTPNLPKELITNGDLSIAQIETIVYAGQAHQEVLPDGQRKGFFIGDGTGVGKGREVSGIIIDSFRQGQKKAVWVSLNKKLIKDAIRDYGDLGGDVAAIKNQGNVKAGTAIKNPEGIIFTTYKTLAQGQSIQGDLLVQKETGKLSRLDQLAQWLGEDFDGVIAFDEAHNMQNCLTMKKKRGSSKPAAMALAGVEFQRRFPNAKIVYASATGATEVENLAYVDRLGLWGQGTPFADKLDFVTKIKAGGLAAMELVARDMKAMGVYISRNISFKGVGYSTLEHQLTPEQTEIYDKMADMWQTVLQNINEALKETGAMDPDTGKTLNSEAKKNAMSAFWGAQQRFFNQVLTSMQMPTAIEAMKKDLKAGKAVVVQLVNTNEAQLNRAIAALDEDQDLEDLDMTPRDQLEMFLQKAFPIYQYEEIMDNNGNTVSILVLDSEGKPVENPEAVAMRDEMIMDLQMMKVPDGPLEILLDELGADNVAEITGRTRRVIRWFNDETGRWERKVESRSEKDALADQNLFLGDKKQVLVFSNAGSTGASYHADKTKKNQRPRRHYLLQAGWTASTAVQGFGRTHRSNEASAPEYILVTTNLKGQKRFISSIARRLDQLGALTKGQRQAAGQGLFSEKDNLEGPMASDALERFYIDLANNDIEDLPNPMRTFEMLGMSKLLDKYGNTKQDNDMREVPMFLNRLLTLPSEMQNRVFDEFSNRLDRMIDSAIANGTMDTGLENFKSDKNVVTNEQTVYTDPVSKAETNLVEFESYNRIRPLTYDEVKDVANMSGFLGYFKNTRSGRIYAVRVKGTTTLRNGRIADSYRMISQDKDNQTITDEVKFSQGNWERVKSDQVETLWNSAVDNLPEFRTNKVHLITGALLPIWDRLPNGRVRVVRVLTDDGRILLGRTIPEASLEATLRNLGAGSTQEELDSTTAVDKVLNRGFEARLSNGWRIVRRQVSGEYRIELSGNDLYSYRKELTDAGIFIERVGSTPRFFIPANRATEIVEKITKYRPVVELVPPGGSSNARFKADFKGLRKDLQLPLQPALLAMQRDDMKAASILSRLLTGEDIVPFKGEGVQGVVYDNQIYLNENTKSPLLYVAKHEMIHMLGDTNPKALKELMDLAKKYFNGNKAMFDYYRSKDYTEEEIWEEFTADVTSEIMEEPGFWAKVKEKAPKTIKALIDIIDQIIKKFSKAVAKEESMLGYISDLEEFKDKVAGVTARSLSRTNKQSGKKIVAAKAKNQAKAPIFYSQLQKIIEEKMPNKARPDQLMNIITKGGVKQEEVDWSGIKEWLIAQRRSVTKEEVMTFLKSNEVQIVEVSKGDHHSGRIFSDRSTFYIDGDNEPWTAQEVIDSANLMRVDSEDTMAAEITDINDAVAYLDLYGVTVETKAGPDETEYERWQIPGGEDYRELLLTLPDTRITRELTFEEYLNVQPNYIMNYQKYLDEDSKVDVEKLRQSDPEEYQFLKDSYELEKKRGKTWTRRIEGDAYKSAHWKEPNILAHVRFNTRTGPKDEKVLFIEEVQSDWHQEGRRKGYKQPLNNADYERIRNAAHKVVDENNFLGYSNRVEALAFIRRNPTSFMDIAKQEGVSESGINALREYAQTVDTGSVPDAPFKKSWQELALKRMIRYAAENGFERIAWTSGEQQAERYSLSKQVGSVQAYRNYKDGKPIPDSYQFFVVDPQGRTIENLTHELATQEQIVEMFGKDLGTRLINGADKAKGHRFEVSGDGLKIGGEGMKGFYDKMLPSFLNKYVKKWGSKVEPTSLDNRYWEPDSFDENGEGVGGQEVNDPIQVQSIPVTPEMRAAVLYTGQPMFKRKAESNTEFRLPSQEVQERIEGARGLKEPTLRVNLKEILADMHRKGTREYEWLPHGFQFGKLKEALRQFKAQKGVAADETQKILHDVTGGLNEHEYTVFTYKVVFDDLAHDFEEQKLLPFALDPDNFEANKEYVDAQAEANPKVMEAVKKRQEAWDKIKKDYIKNQRAIGHKVDKKLKREDYFRHQILEYAADKIKGTGKELKTPTGRGFLKKREGSTMDFNTEYLQAEYEVMAQMLFDSEIAKVIKTVKDNYDIVNRLKKQATVQNDAGMIEIFQNLLKAMDQPDGDPYKMYSRLLNKKQAKAFGDLYEMAAKGELPNPDGKYDDLIAGMAEVHADSIFNAEEDEGEGRVRPQLPDELRGQLFEYLNYLCRQTESEQASIKARTVYKGMAEKTKMIKNSLGDKFVTWEDLIPPGHTIWQPQKGHMFYLANSIPEGIAEQIALGLAEEVGITPDILRKVRAVGQNYPELVLPEEVAATLENLYNDTKQAGPLANALYYKPYRFWKMYQLLSPRRAFKYNARNFTGDIDAVLAGNPSALQKLPQAWKDLKEAFFTKDHVYSPELYEWFKRGGFQTLLQAQEIYDVNRQRMFKHLVEQRMKKTPMEKLAGAPKATILGYFDFMRDITDFREALLRYATYLDYVEQIENNKTGRPKNFGASRRDEIMVLDDPRDKAAKLANDLLGAYDEVSIYGTWLADHLFPFWRWNEVNFTRYKQLFVNAAQDGKLMGSVAGKVTGMAIKSPYIAWKVGIFACKALALTALITAWNLRYPDEEKDLPEDVRNRLHIIFGRDKNGNVIYFSRLGALQDFVDWFGMDTPVKTAQDFLSGKKGIKEIAIDMAKNDVNKLYQAITPYAKNTFETIFGYKTYPDMFNPSKIRDRGQYLADSFGLSNEYKKAFGKPTRGYASSLYDIAIYKSDPYETAYFESLDMKDEFMKSVGKGSGGSSSFTPKSNALYNMKLAMRYGDKEAYDKYLAEYIAAGGTPKGYEQSLRTMDPLFGLSKAEQGAFYNGLDAEEKEKFMQAMNYYYRVVGAPIN